MKNIKKNILLLSLFTFLILFLILKDNFLEIIKTISSSKLIYIVFLLIAVFIGDIAKALSIRNVAISSNQKYSLIKSYILILKTNFFAGITPLAVGAQPFQLYSLKKDGDIDYSIGASIIFIDYYAYQLSIFVLTTLFLIINYLFEIIYIENGTYLFILIGYFIVTIILILLTIIINSKNTNIIDKIINKIINIKLIKNKDKIKTEIYKSINEIKESRHIDKKIFFKSLVFNIIKVISFAMASYFCFKAINLNIKLIDNLIITTFVVLIGSFVPIPGGSGGIEMSFIKLYSNYLIGSTLSASLLMWRFFTFYILIIVGALAFLINQKIKNNREEK